MDIEPNKCTASFNEMLNVKFGDAVVPLFDSFIYENGKIKEYFFNMKDGLHLDKLGKNLLKSSIEYHTLKFKERPVHATKQEVLTHVISQSKEGTKGEPREFIPAYRATVPNIVFCEENRSPKLADIKEFPPLVEQMSPTGCYRTGYACALKKVPVIPSKPLVDIKMNAESHRIPESGILLFNTI